MDNTVYKKVVDENGNERFIEVVVEPAAPQQETKPAEKQGKTFGQIMSEVWTWLRPRLSGGVAGAGILFGVLMALGGKSKDTPQIPGGGPGVGGGLGNGPDSLS